MQAITVSNPPKTVSSSSLLHCATHDYMFYGSARGGQDDFGEDYCASVGEKSFPLVEVLKSIGVPIHTDIVKIIQVSNHVGGENPLVRSMR